MMHVRAQIAPWTSRGGNLGRSQVGLEAHRQHQSAGERGIPAAGPDSSRTVSAAPLSLGVSAWSEGTQ
jgi:hypothetical protein